MAIRWSAQEDWALTDLSGSASSMNELLKALPGRSASGIRARSKKLGFRIWQGTWTFTQLIRETGYNWKQVYRARDALGQKWRRAPIPPRTRLRGDGKGGSRWRISEEQAQAILDYLKDEPTPFAGRARDGTPTPRRTWANKWSCCQNCKTSGARPSQRHQARGLCQLCYKNWRLARKPPLTPEQQAAKRARTAAYARERRKRDPRVAERERASKRAAWAAMSSEQREARRRYAADLRAAQRQRESDAHDPANPGPGAAAQDAEAGRVPPCGP